MLSQNLIHNASPAQAIGKAVWMGCFVRSHYRMTKSAKMSGEIRPQSAFWTDSPALCGERAGSGLQGDVKIT